MTDQDRHASIIIRVDTEIIVNKEVKDLITTDIIIKAADTTVSKEVKDLIITVREDITDLITTIVLMAISNKEDLKITDLIITEDLITEIKLLNHY
jgi:hypothetical protein